MTSLLVVTVTENNDSEVTMKYVKKWSTSRGKRQIREACVREALLRHPNYRTVTAKWEPDMQYKEDDNGDITLEADDLEGMTVIRYLMEQRGVMGQWTSLFKVRLHPESGALIINALRHEGVEVAHAVR